MTENTRLGRGLRSRVIGLVLGSSLLAALAFYAALLSFTRQWLLHELDYRATSLAEVMARRVATPLLVGDQSDLENETARVSLEPDVLGVEIRRADGEVLALRSRDLDLWQRVPHDVSPGRPGADAPSAIREILGHEVRIFVAPVVREERSPTAPEEEARELFGFLPSSTEREAGSEPVGTVRVAMTTSRLQQSLLNVSRMGILILFTVMGLGLLASIFFLGVVVRPLREASGLAEEIAAGNLDRRIPVRGRDELGALAESMNLMASSLSAARRRAQDEEAALRRATAAVVAIAQGARGAGGLPGVFRIVAEQVAHVTSCDGVALAVPEADGRCHRFVYFDPPAPWGELAPGTVLDPNVARQLAEADPLAVRLALDSAGEPFTWSLVAVGHRSALLVPLTLAEGPPAALLLVSNRPAAFPPAQVDVVSGLASHLSAALQSERLRLRLEHAHDELERTRDQLVRSEKLRMAGELASGVAHEFNNVLGAILGRAQLLRMRVRSGNLPTEELTGALDVMERVAQDGADTVRRLRQFAIGADPSGTEVVDLDAAIRDAVEYTRPRWETEALAAGRHLTVRVLSRPGSWVEGRPSELREVFTNLLLNAADAMPGDGVIVASCQLQGESVVARIADDGAGMSEETRARVFDPFFTTKGDKGTGLGLTVVYGIVARHGGRISVESGVGRGTRVDVTLPAAAAPAASTPVAEGPKPAALSPLSVLAVDDEPAVLDLVCDIVEALGHRVDKHSSAEPALRSIAPGRYDLILTDLGMPGMTGWEFSKSVRQIDPDVMLAWITGWGEELVGDETRRAGADAVVAKPFTVEDVRGLIEKAGARRARKAA